MPHRSIGKLPWFWIILGLGFALAGFLAWHISATDGGSNEYVGTAAGWNYAIFTRFKVPLNIISTTAIILGFYVTIHRSKQAAHIIKQSTSQNNIANYYKHREEFFKYLDTIEDKHNVKFVNRIKLYESIYPNNSLESGHKHESDRNAKDVEYFSNNIDAVRRLKKLASALYDEYKTEYDKVAPFINSNPDSSQDAFSSLENKRQKINERFENIIDTTISKSYMRVIHVSKTAVVGGGTTGISFSWEHQINGKLKFNLDYGNYLLYLKLLADYAKIRFPEYEELKELSKKQDYFIKSRIDSVQFVDGRTVKLAEFGI